MVEEVGERENEAAEVPDADHDVHGADFLDPAPLALNDHGVFDAEGLRECDLDSGDEVGEGALRGEANDQAGESGGGENAFANVPDGRKGHEHDGQRDDDDQHNDDAVQHLELRLNAARSPDCP